MTATGTSLADAGRKTQMVQTACHLAECSRKWTLRQKTSDSRLYGGICSCSVNDDRSLRRRRRPGKLDTGTVDSDTVASYRSRLGMP